MTRPSIPALYGGLFIYLNGRQADTVVLTFGEIEDLLGFALPDPARVRQEWWGSVDARGDPTSQSRAWTAASRTASANLFARMVTFERIASS